MHVREASDVAAVRRETASVLSVDVGDGFGEPVGKTGAGEDIAARCGADERVDVVEVIFCGGGEVEKEGEKGEEVCF